MYKKGLKFLWLTLSCILLSGCITDVWTGVSLVYDRHNVYKKISDFELAANVNHAIYKDKAFKRSDCYIDMAISNGDILLAGHVPTIELRQEAFQRIAALNGHRRIFNQLAIATLPDNSIQDDWITAKIRSQIFADSDINPHDFKVITSDQIVYLMGDVIPKEAAIVINIAQECDGVKRVVKLFKYYNLSDKPEH
jgi:osmotically-inducible protein OsmY